MAELKDDSFEIHDLFVEVVAASVSAVLGSQWGPETLYSGLAQGLGAGGVHARGQYRSDIVMSQMVGDDVTGFVEPEIADLAQHLALAGDRVGQHHVERAEAVGGHDQQALVTEVEHVADLAAVTQVEAGQVRFEQGRRHG